jgi:hypothetical protein
MRTGQRLTHFKFINYSMYMNLRSGAVLGAAGVLLAVVRVGCGLTYDDSLSAEYRQRMNEAFSAAFAASRSPFAGQALGQAEQVRLLDRDCSPARR